MRFAEETEVWARRRPDAVGAKVWRGAAEGVSGAASAAVTRRSGAAGIGLQGQGGAVKEGVPVAFGAMAEQ